MHECPKTHFKHKCRHASHHAMSPCHIIMPCNHATSSCHLACHIIMPCQHAISSCHVSMPCHHAISTCYVIMPHHHAMSSCHIIMPCHHATSLCHIIMTHYHAMCHSVSGATWHLFLPNLHVDLIEHNAITFSYRVCLRWNECRWNCLDEPFELVLVLIRLEDFKIFSFLDPPGSITHPLLPFSSPILLHVGFLHAAEVSCVLSFAFLLIFLIFACPEIRFGYYSASEQERFTFSCVFMDSPMAGHRFYLTEWPRS